MPSKCFVAGCRSNYNASAKGRVFGFPKDEEIRKLWIQAINREDKREPTKSSKICEHHFKPEDFITSTEFLNSKTREIVQIPLQKYRLSKDAVPSVFTNLHPVRKRRKPQPPSVTESPILEVEDSQDSAADAEPSSSSANMRRCVVPGCRSNFQKPYVSVFHFPKSPGFRNLWLKKIGCPLMNVKDHSVVCIKHFDRKFIVDRMDVTNGGSSRKRIGIKPGAVPTIFEEQEVDNLSEDTDKSQDMMKVKDGRSASTSEVSKASDDDEESGDSEVSETEETTPTTDRPFIAVIKPNDFQADQPLTTEEVFEDSMNSPSKPSPSGKSSRPNSNTKQRNVSSPYKNLPPVILNDEDRLNVQKELFKSNKRSLSTCSNSSLGSSEAVRVQPKRRKVEKPAPTVIGKQNDCYCWVCHRENVVLSCIACPRAYHIKCANENGTVLDWVCPECQKILAAENVDTRSSVLSEISLDKFCTLLRFCLNKMKHRAGVAFHQPVSLEHYPMYLHYVIHPMDFSLLEKNIKQKLYGCTEAFLADVKWILHNSCVFNGSHHPLSTNAKSMVKACDNDMQEIEVCPDCFMHNIVRNKYWFSEVCHKPHPLVWAKLKGFPYWPAKVVRIVDGNIDARFFGAHDRAWVPISQCYHLSKEMPTSSKPKKKGNYETALDELSVHVQLLIQKYGSFEYAPYRTNFDQENKHLMYHGINIDQVNKEETQSDISPTIRTENFSPSEVKMGTNTSKELAESKDSDCLKLDTDSNHASKIASDESSFSGKDNKVTENEPQEEVSLSSDQQSSPLSQRKKIELALQRIKGYISNDIDEEEKEKEASESQPNQEQPPPQKKDSETVSKDDKEDDICLSDLIKARALPPIDLPTIDDVPEKEAPPVLDAAKKDSFSLKLIETIASCKAKLGISGDMDKSDSHDSDSVEDEEEDEDEEEEESEDEDAEKQDNESDSKHAKQRRKVTSDAGSTEEDASDESSSESDAESVSSNTDIEIVEDPGEEAVGEKIDNITEPLTNADNKGGKSLNEKEALSKNTESDTVSTNLSVSGETISSKILDDGSAFETENAISSKSVPTTVSEIDKSDCVEEDKVPYPSPAARSRSISSNALQSSTDDLTDTDIQLDAIGHQSVSQCDATPTKADVQSKEDAKSEGNEMEDDDIYICPPVRPPTPPLICLDDGTETEPEENADNNANKNKFPVNSFHSIKLPSPDKKIGPESTDKYVSILKNAKLIPQNARKSVWKRPMREITSEDDSSDDSEFASVRPSPKKQTREVTFENNSNDCDFPPKVPLSGAIRTFNNRGRTIVAGPQVNSEPEKPYSGILVPSERLQQVSPALAKNSNFEKTINNMESDAISDSATEPMSELAAKNAEISKLKKKLGCIFSAFQLQQWKSAQEKSELRHNMNLMIMEMRASLEADKKQTIENLAKTLEREKQRCIEETKKKQWCAYCLQESRYACCWNTSYCTVACQKRHINEHRNFCTQLRTKSREHEVVRSLVSTATGADPKEGKKVLVLNVLTNKDAKSSGDPRLENSKQISISKVMSPKQSIQLVSTSSPQTNSSVQYVLATSLKPTSSPVAESPKSTLKADNSDGVELGNNAEECNSAESNNQHSTNKEQNFEKAEPSLEEIYFPSPPTVCFEGLDTALPDESINFADLAEASESHASDNELRIAEESSAEDDILSDNDEVDNERVNIGRGIEIKAKSLNQCLIYGKDAKKLTRCLADVIFPTSLLAVCSAFGNKSNVTKLTRAALPCKKVEAIIEYVQKRYPQTSRSEIVLAINMKCKEARTLIGRSDISGKTKKKFRRLLGREQNEDDTEELQEAKSLIKQRAIEKSQETKNLNEGETSSTEASTSRTLKPKLITVLKKTVPNVVNLQTTTNQAPKIIKSPLEKPVSKPNILRMSRQVLIRPKYNIPAVPNKLMLPPPSAMQYRNRAPTIRSLLNIQQPLVNPTNERSKLVLPVGMVKKAAIASRPTMSSAEANNANAPQRPYFIIGSSPQRPGVSTVQQSPSTLQKN